ncbi:OmpA family protein [Mesorhizobium sp. VNQ89]|uniref:OmpA family protein n=1 Tax=Mesorhizobium quangtriensis TaxID=3157709 RepID=UPI0032B8427A
MSKNLMTLFPKIIQAGVFAGLLAFASACSTTDSGGLTPSNPSDTLPNQAGGYTDDVAAGFENVQPGSEQDFILTAGRRIYFAQSSAALDDTAKATINNQIAFLQKYPKWFAKLQGFADDPGNNQQLSQQRADAVMNYMIAGGIAPGRLWAKGYGKDREVRSCSERACKVQNRRVVTNLRLQRED